MYAHTHMFEMRDVYSIFPAVPHKFMSSNKSSYARSLNATKGDFSVEVYKI